MTDKQWQLAGLLYGKLLERAQQWEDGSTVTMRWDGQLEQFIYDWRFSVPTLGGYHFEKEITPYLLETNLDGLADAIIRGWGRKGIKPSSPM